MNPLWIAALLTVAAPLACAAQVRLGDPAPNPEKARAEAVERATTVLRDALELPKTEAIAVESSKAATWPDASLGCPEKDHMYAQVRHVRLDGGPQGRRSDARGARGRQAGGHL